MAEREEGDSWLQDFSKGFSGNYRDTDGSVLDGALPQAYVQRFHEINGPESNARGQRKEVESIVAAGITISPTPDGGLVLRKGTGSIVVPAGQVADFLDGCRQAATQRAPGVPAPTQMSSSNRQFSQNELVVQSDATRKARFERNMREMEKLARASAFEYPKYT